MNLDLGFEERQRLIELFAECRDFCTNVDCVGAGVDEIVEYAYGLDDSLREILCILRSVRR